MSFQRKCLLNWVVIFACSITLYCCHPKTYHSPDGYDLENPQKFELGNDLTEISGLSFDTDNGNLLCISDSRRSVTAISLKKQKLKDYTGKVVPPESDLEDIVKTPDALYLLSSKGIIYQVNGSNSKDSNAVTAYRLTANDQDFETLYYDSSRNSLIMMCKECDFDKGKHARSAFRFNLQTKKFDSTVYYTISTDEVKKVLKDDNAKFDPSAAAIHPITGQLYILSSAGNLLVIADSHGHVSEAYDLDPAIYPQAEGIAFAPNGSMFISNEGKNGAPTLLIFKYQPNGKTKDKK